MVPALGNQGGKRRKMGGSEGAGMELGLAQVPHPGALAAEFLKGTKSSPPLTATLPENPAERISFRFGSRAFAVVFHSWEEQKPGIASWLLPGSPLPPCQLWGNVGSRKLDRAVPVSHDGATARRGWR